MANNPQFFEINIEQVARKISGQTIGMCVTFEKLSNLPIDQMRELFEKFISPHIDNVFFIVRLITNVLSLLPSKYRVSIGYDIFLRPAYSLIKNFNALLLTNTSTEENVLLREISILNSNVEFNFDDFSLKRSSILQTHVEEKSVPRDTLAFDSIVKDIQVSESPVVPTKNSFFEKVAQEEEEEDAYSTANQRAIIRTNESGKTYVNSIEETHVIFEDIRSKFGLNLTLDNEEAISAVSHLQELSKRSIKHLSSDLYSEDIHSILELTQNADDNNYSNGVLPTLSINLSDNNDKNDYYGDAYPFILRFSNNEVGFCVENVNAICDISKSTKSLKDPGYIGHKGIGFKSVFKLTDRPEIHSNYFHFQFDSRGDILGYIIPKHAPIPDSWDPTIDKTMIILPLRIREENTNEELLKNICDQLNHISDAILLFLHRLRCMEINISSVLGSKVAGWKRKKFRKNQQKDSIVKVHVTEEFESGVTEKSITWFITQHKFDINIDTPTTTEISIAFRIDHMINEKSNNLLSFNDGQLDIYDMQTFSEKWMNSVRIFQKFCDLPDHPVFAFLPLRSYGFRFTLQADWKVTSSRETVDTNTNWNLLIRDEIPDAFTRSIVKLIEHAIKLDKNNIVQKKSQETSKKNAIEIENKGEIDDNEDDNEDDDNEDDENSSFSEDCIVCLNLIFHLIPTKNQIIDFFSTVPKIISQKLSSLKFIPTNENTFEEAKNVVLHPLNSKAVSMSSFDDEKFATSRSLLNSDLEFINITSKLLKKYRNLSFTNPLVIIPPHVVSELNLQQLNFSIFFSILQHWDEVKSIKNSNSYLVWILEQLDSYIDHSMHEKLKKLAIFPLLNGSTIAICSEKKLFFMSKNRGTLLQKYEEIPNLVLDHDFASKLRNNASALRTVRHCCALEEISDHSFVYHVALRQFKGLYI